MKIEQRLIPILKGVQAVQGWSEQQLSQELGLSPRLVSMLYRGERGIGKEFLARILRRFPALKDEIVKAMMESDCDAA